MNNLYNNILRRGTDTDGYNYWVRQLNTRIEDRGELLLGFAKSTENKVLFGEMNGIN